MRRLEVCTMEERRAGEAGEPQGAVSGAAHVPSWDLAGPPIP